MTDTAAPPLDETASPPRGADVWDRMVHSAIGLARTAPVRSLTTATVAGRAGVPREVAALLFPSDDDLVIAAVQVWLSERTAPLRPIAERFGAVAFLRAVLLVHVQDPRFMRLLLQALNLSDGPDDPMGGLLERQWLSFHAFVQRALAEDVRAGREPDTMEPSSGAEQLLALYQGLQVQSALRPSMDLVAAWDRAVTRMRDGWSRAYAPPTWVI